MSTHRNPRGHDISLAIFLAALVFLGLGVLCLPVGAAGEPAVLWVGLVLCALGVIECWALVEYRTQRQKRGAAGQDAEALTPAQEQQSNGAAEQEETPPYTQPTATDEHDISPSAIERLITRSDDVVATLADFEAHNPQTTLGRAIRRSGILSWNAPLAFRAGRLSRNGRYWFFVDTDRIESEANYDALVSAEAALNVYQDAFGLQESDSGKLEWRMAEVLRRVTGLEPPSAATTGSLASAEASGEWNARLSFAEFAEGAPLPLRLSFDLEANVADGMLAVDVELPRPAAFAFLWDDSLRRAAAARAYALRLAALCARHAFKASARVEKVEVRGHEHGSDTALLCLLLARDELDGFVATVQEPTLDGGELPDCDQLSISPTSDGWLSPLQEEPRIIREELAPSWRQSPMEMNHAATPPALAKATGATRVDELGINESAGRVAAWDKVAPLLDGTTGTAVRLLVRLRDEADDMSVSQAASRACDALIDGSLDAADFGAMRALFVDGSELDVACRMASTALEKSEDANYSAILASLEEALAHVTQDDPYADTPATVWRYFGSMAERVRYNLDLSDGSEVRLVPDAYYVAHVLATQMATSLGMTQQAQRHVGELMRIAPSTLDPLLTKVRILEDASRLFDAIDLLKHIIAGNPSPRELAIAFYRLAYLEWKAGNSQAGIACYQRSVQIFPAMAAECERELAQLMATEDGLRLLDAEELLQTLETAGIPLGDPTTFAQRALDGARAAIDACVFSAGWQLLGSYLQCEPSDVLVDVYRSVRPSG